MTCHESFDQLEQVIQMLFAYKLHIVYFVKKLAKK